MKIVPRQLHYLGIVTNRTTPAEDLIAIEINRNDPNSWMTALGEVMKHAQVAASARGDVHRGEPMMRVRVIAADPEILRLVEQARADEKSEDPYRRDRAREALDGFERNGIRIGGTYAIAGANKIGVADAEFTSDEGDHGRALVVFRAGDVIAEIDADA